MKKSTLLVFILITISILILVSSFIVCSNQNKQEPYAKEQTIAHIKQLLKQADIDQNEGDLDGFMSNIAPDIKLMMPNSSTISGADSMRLVFGNLFQSYNIEFQHQLLEIHVIQDFVIERGNGIGTMIPKTDGEPIPVNNKYLHVWEKQIDGSWKILWSMFNSN